MRFPSQSDLWRLDHIMKAKPLTSNGQSRAFGRFRQIYPLTLFPDELIIEELRVIWVRKMGPWTSEIITIMATDIACVNASRGLIFGHIHIKSLTGGPEIFVDKLLGHQVYQARSLIEGIALSSREGLKIEHQDLETERAQLLRAGHITSANT